MQESEARETRSSSGHAKESRVWLWAGGSLGEAQSTRKGETVSVCAHVCVCVYVRACACACMCVA